MPLIFLQDSRKGIRSLTKIVPSLIKWRKKHFLIRCRGNGGNRNVINLVKILKIIYITGYKINFQIVNVSVAMVIRPYPLMIYFILILA